MPRVTFVHPDGHKQTVDADPGDSVMKIATSNLVSGIIGECGGELICATCHVFVDPGWLDSLPPMSETEREMLDVASEEPTEYSRLSCQIVVTDTLDGLTVQIPDTQL
jgi:2Fe-2S ferredoxin